MEAAAQAALLYGEHKVSLQQVIHLFLFMKPRNGPIIKASSGLQMISVISGSTTQPSINGLGLKVRRMLLSLVFMEHWECLPLPIIPVGAAWVHALGLITTEIFGCLVAEAMALMPITATDRK